MKTNKWILGGLMAMAITACTSDELVENTNPTLGRKVTVTAYAPGDEANSRVTPTDKPDDGLVSLVWDKNDSFTVIQGNANTNFTNGDGGGNTFTGVLPNDTSTDDDNFYAVYPARSVSEASESSGSVTVPFDLSEQTGALDASKTYMRASSESGLSYSFQHCTAILKATFANIPANTTISQVVVKTSHADSKVDGNLNLATGTISGGSKNTITIDYDPAVDANTPVYIYLPPMAAAKKELAFEVSIEGGDSYTGTLGASTPQPIEGESSNANQGKGIEAGNLYAASVQMSKVRLIAEGLSFDHNTKTFSVTTAFALQLLDKWISNKISAENLKEYEFPGNDSDLLTNNNRYSLNISIKADIELPLTDILTGQAITLDANGVPSGSNWIPLQKSTSEEFSGSIDGINGTDGKYSIKNLRINGGDNSFQGFVGRFSGSITNLKFIDAVVFATSEGESEYVGVVVGLNKGGNVQFCDVTGTSMVSGRKVGGVVGQTNNGTVDNCVNYAKVNGVSYSGGIVGSFSHNGTTIISNCKNYGNVSISGEKVGGIVGYLYNSIINISDCENRGTITGAEEVGGILGCSYGKIEVSERYIERCSNYGAVTGGESGGEQFVGGIVGNIGYASVRGCNNYASVTGHGFYIGGIVGSIENSILTNCKNIALESRSESMAVSGVKEYSQRVGGIAGDIYKSTVENCENNCPVSGAAPIGGIVGYTTSNSTVRGCINDGTTTATCDYRVKGVGGVVGFIDGNSNVENCKNNGQVSGIERVGGIVGHSTGSSIVLGSINNGDVVASKKYAGGIVGYNETAGVIACGNNATITSPTSVGGVVGGMIGTIVNNNLTANVGIYGSWSIYGNNYYGYDQKSAGYRYYDYGNYVGDAATLNDKVGSKDDATSGSMNKALADYYGTNLGSSLTTKYYWVEGSNGPTFPISASAGLNNFGFGGNLTPSDN